MRSKPLLPALLLVGAGLSPLAQASSDDSCYPDWSLVGGGVCDTLPFLAPGNDTRANLRLLLADAGHWRLVEAPPSEEEKLEGYGLVPFGLFRLLPGDGSQPPAPPAARAAGCRRRAAGGTGRTVPGRSLRASLPPTAAPPPAASGRRRPAAGAGWRGCRCPGRGTAGYRRHRRRPATNRDSRSRRCWPGPAGRDRRPPAGGREEAASSA